MSANLPTTDPRDAIADIVRRYEVNRAEYLKSSSTYVELDARAEYVDLFLAALSWDVTNRDGRPSRLREVVRETRVNVDENTKRPDYECRLGTERRFFVEVKKPNVDIINTPKPAFQVRRYGWSAGLMISVLMNVEDLVIYDTTTEPEETHGPEHSRIYRFHYSEYVDRFDEISQLISRAAVYSGDFDEQFSDATQNRPAEKIDAVFLDQLNRWRLALCTDLYANDPTISETDLNEIAQRLVLRILFLRMCEDRGIQTYEHLKNVALTNDWNNFTNLLVECDRRYDSNLFDTTNDPFCSGANRLQLNTQTVLSIIESLYFPAAPYTFSVIEPEFLGSVYEQFLTERVQIRDGEPALVRKPEHEDRDIVSTPRPIIERVVQDTIAPALQGLTAPEIFEKRVLDPATGSGGFLISAFDVFADALTTAYLTENNHTAIYETANGYQLTFEEKARLLTGCLYGVDRDYLAIEVARFSLLVKLLEDETSTSLPATEPLLPPLSENVVYGDSLIDESIRTEQPGAETIGPPLTWGVDLPDKFDFIVGNPPYLKTEDMINLEPAEHRFYLRHYKTAYKQFDKYYLFIERAIRDLLKPDGKFGMIVSRKFAHIESGKKIRKLLSDKRIVRRLIDFGNAQLFEARTTYTCLLFLGAPNGDGNAPLPYELVASPKDWIAQQTSTAPAMNLPRQIISGDKSWILPNTPAELELVEALLEGTIPLGKIMDVFNGIQTSRNSVYVIQEWTDVNDELISFTKDERDWRIEKAILKPFFDGELGQLKSFSPLTGIVPIIFPYFITLEDGALRARTIPSETLREEYPGAWEWLEHNQADLQTRDIRPADFPPDEWYRYGRDQALTSFEDCPKIIVGVNSQGDKYVYDDSNTLLASGGTAGECAIAHFQNPASHSRYDLHFVLAILNHKAIEYFCRKRGSPFRGGWYARGTAVLKEVPVPDIDFDSDDNQLRLYREITELSRQLCDDNRALSGRIGSLRDQLTRRIAANKRLMEARISELYGIERIIDRVELPT
jgi:hypothetical protein